VTQEYLGQVLVPSTKLSASPGEYVDIAIVNNTAAGESNVINYASR
jgi:hypothetical protein